MHTIGKGAAQMHGLCLHRQKTSLTLQFQVKITSRTDDSQHSTTPSPSYSQLATTTNYATSLDTTAYTVT